MLVVYIYGKESHSVVINDGEISHNKASSSGGGVSCFANSGKQAKITINGGKIYDNESTSSASNMSIGGNSYIKINGGYISDGVKDSISCIDINSSSNESVLDLVGNQTKINGSIRYNGSVTGNNYIAISKPFTPQGYTYRIANNYNTIASTKNITIKPIGEVTDASQYRNYFQRTATSAYPAYGLGKNGTNISCMPVCFVNGVTGSDDNNGLTVSKPFKTMAKAQAFATTNTTLTTAYVSGTITVDDAQTWSSSILNIERYTGQAVAGVTSTSFDEDMVHIASGGDLTLSGTTLLGNTGGADDSRASGAIINNEGTMNFAAATTNTLLGNLRTEDQVQINQNGTMNLGGTICMDGTTCLLNNKTISVLATGFIPTTGTTLSVEAQDDSADRVMVNYPSEDMTNSESFVLSDDQATQYSLVNGATTGTLALLAKNVAYVDTQQGNDSLDGTTKEKAVASYAKAYELLATEGGTIYSLHTTQIDSTSFLSGTTDGTTTIASGKVSIQKDASMNVASPLFNVKNGATLSLKNIKLQGTQQDTGALVLTEQGGNLELLDNAKVTSIKTAGLVTVSGSGINVTNDVTLDNSTTGNTPYIEVRGDGTDSHHIAVALQKLVKGYELVRYVDDFNDDIKMVTKKGDFYLSAATSSFYVEPEAKSMCLKQREGTLAISQEPCDQLLNRDGVMSTIALFADTEDLDGMVVKIKRNGEACKDAYYVIDSANHRLKIYMNCVLVGQYEVECTKDDLSVTTGFTVSSYYVTYHNDYNQFRLKNSVGSALNYDQATLHVTSGYSENRTINAASFDTVGDFKTFNPVAVDTITKTTPGQLKGEMTDNTTLTANKESEHTITLYNSDGITSYCKGTVSVSPLQIKNGNEICAQTSFDMPIVTLEPQNLKWNCSGIDQDNKASIEYTNTIYVNATCQTTYPQGTTSYASANTAIADVLDENHPTTYTGVDVGKVNIVASITETEKCAAGTLNCELTVGPKLMSLSSSGSFVFANMTYKGKNNYEVDDPTSGSYSLSIPSLTPIMSYTRRESSVGYRMDVYSQVEGIRGEDANKYYLAESQLGEKWCGSVNVLQKTITLTVPDDVVTKPYDGAKNIIAAQKDALAAYTDIPAGAVSGDAISISCDNVQYPSVDVATSLSLTGFELAGEDKTNYKFDTSYDVKGTITQAEPTISLANTKKDYLYLEERQPISATATFGQNEVAGTFSYVDGPTKLTQNVTQKWKFDSDDTNFKSVEGSFDIKVTGTKQVLSFKDDEAQSGSKTINLVDGITTIVATNSAIEGTPITYTSSNPLVATVNASTGAITPLKKGTITISVDTPEKVGYYAGHSEFTLTIDRWVVANIVWNTASFADMTYCGKDDVSIVAPQSGGPTLSNAPGITPIIKYKRAYSSAGDDVTVTAEITGFTGTDAADYRLPTISYNANYAKVNVKKQKTSLDLSNVKISKVYDGTADLTTQQVKALTSSMPSPSNIVAGDQVTVDVSKVAYVSAQAGAKKYVKGFALSGDDVANYEFTQPNEFTAEIKKAKLTVTYVGDKIKEGETPTFSVKVTGFVHDETPETAASYAQPTVTGGDPATAGTYKLSPMGGFAINYDFVYVAGNLVVTADPSKLDESNIIHGNESDVKGSLFSLLQAKATKITKNKVTVKWKKVSGATGYMVYTSRCGRNRTPKKVANLSASKTSYTQSKLKKSLTYKYIIAAYKMVNGKKQIITISKTIHIITAGSKKFTNAIAVKANKSSVSLKVNKSFKLKLSEVVPKKKKVNIHRKICCESSDKTIATVTNAGVIKAKAPGTCTIFTYAQNGVMKKIKVTVK